MVHRLTIILILAVFAAMVLWFAGESREKIGIKEEEIAAEQKIRPLEEPRVTIIDPIRGNPRAQITIVEFGDYICAFCKQVEPELGKVLAAYPEKVRLVWKDLPIDDLHAHASRSAIAARCAGEQGKFWEFHDRLLAEREEVLAPPISAIAAELSLDEQEFSECLDSPRPRAQIEKTMEEARALGVTGAPFFYINGRPSTGRTFADFDAAIKAIDKAWP